MPEAASPRVLVAPDAPLDRTTEVQRPITIRHLLTLTCGWGAVLEGTPLQAAMMERGVYPGPLTPQMSGDEFVARVAGLPLAFQPGEGWLYDTGIDVLGVLLARATGKPLSDLLAERITGPLGMASTSFGTPDAGRLATAYQPGPGGLEVLDPPDGVFADPPGFEELSSGLVSTAPDVLRFFCAMADGGGPVLTADSVALMTADALTDAQRRQALPIVGPGGSWGLATGVDVEAAEPWMAPGRWGWDGGTGTTALTAGVRTRETGALHALARGGESRVPPAIVAPRLARGTSTNSGSPGPGAGITRARRAARGAGPTSSAAPAAPRRPLGGRTPWSRRMPARTGGHSGWPPRASCPRPAWPRRPAGAGRGCGCWGWGPPHGTGVGRVTSPGRGG